jgi:hypothetical protein
MLCKALGHGFYQNWARTQLHLTQALNLVKSMAGGSFSLHIQLNKFY